MASQLKDAASKLAGKLGSGGAGSLRSKFMKWLRWQGGAMDTYLLKGTEEKREQTGSETFDQWAFRYPAPGSQPQTQVPYREQSTFYDIKHYPRDVRRNPSPFSDLSPDFAMIEAAERKLLESKAAGKEVKAEPPKIGSPGSANPDVMRYNKDGLRSAMTATIPATEKELAKHVQTHMPRPEWLFDAGDIIEDCKAKGIPPVPGRGLRAKAPKIRYDPRW